MFESRDQTKTNGNRQEEMWIIYSGEGGLLPKMLGGSVPHGSQNPDPISDQNI